MFCWAKAKSRVLCVCVCVCEKKSRVADVSWKRTIRFLEFCACNYLRVVVKWANQTHGHNFI